MPSVIIRGKSIFYTIDESPTSASTTLFIHGLGSSSCFYQTIVQPHLKSVTRCIALDTAGSGLSQLGSGEQSIATIAEDAIAVLDAVKISEKVIVVGHSMGGIVASYLAATYPGRVKGVVLIGPVNPAPSIAPIFEKRIETVKAGTSDTQTRFTSFLQSPGVFSAIG
jgi:pimeloyl-ACP methyl ester carboxylesterase